MRTESVGGSADGPRPGNFTRKLSAASGSGSRTRTDMVIARRTYFWLLLLWFLSLSASLLLLIGPGHS